MKNFNLMKPIRPALTAAAAVFLSTSIAATAIAGDVADALSKIDASGKATDTATEFTLSGIVAARLVQPDGKVVAFIHNPGKPALSILADEKSAADFTPRNVINISGKLGEGPFGAALIPTAGSIKITETNKMYPSEKVAGALFKDASAMSGRYVQVTNCTFAAGKFDATGAGTVKAGDGSDVPLLLGKGAAGRDVPDAPMDVFGVIVKAGTAWKLVAVRFLPVDRAKSLDLATLRTCITCHNPEAKLIGPAYRDVAAKYRNDPDAITKFVTQMQTGGTGKWGTNVMIPLKGIVPPEDMNTLAHWVYGYRWDAVLAE